MSPHTSPPPRTPERATKSRVLLGVLALLTVPFPFIGNDATLFGLPLWLCWSALWTTALSVTTSLVILRTWRFAEDDEAPGPENGSGD